MIEYKAVKPVPCFVSTKKTRQKCIGCDRIIEEHRGEITERKQSSVGSVLFSFLPTGAEDARLSNKSFALAAALILRIFLLQCCCRESFISFYSFFNMVLLAVCFLQMFL